MTVRDLRLTGHDVRDIRGTPDEGIQDDALWAMAQQEERLLITTDKGFTQYRAEPHHGVLIIRLRRPNRQKIHARIMQAMRQFSEQEWRKVSGVQETVHEPLPLPLPLPGVATSSARLACVFCPFAPVKCRVQSSPPRRRSPQTDRPEALAPGNP